MKKQFTILFITILTIFGCSQKENKEINSVKPVVTPNISGFTCPNFGVNVTKIAQHCSVVADSANFTRLYINDVQFTTPNARVFNYSPGRSFTTSTGASGFQVSSSRDAVVNYGTTITTTSTLSGNASGYIVLETAATNSSTPSDWKEIARVPSGQNNTLVVGITLSQTGGGTLAGSIQAGWYVKIRTVSSSGTPTFTLNSQEEVTQ